MNSKSKFMTEKPLDDPDLIFQKGSTTYYNSTKLFPANIRKDVTTLYAFVRIADNYVDAVPQDIKGFNDFKSKYYDALDGVETDNTVIQNYIELSQRMNFEQEWTDAFLESMEMDTYKSEYNNIDELNKYLYGSSEVIGLMMNRIMNIDKSADESAKYLGKAMQFINFIRDIDEDLDLNRTYFPKDMLNKFGLNSLTRGEARRKPKQFESFVKSQVALYFKWQKKAEVGIDLIPARMRVAVKTASDMYAWTAMKIYNDPFIVYTTQIKPSKGQVLISGIKNLAKIYLSFGSKPTISNPKPQSI